MLKKIVSASAIVVALMFSGCGDSDSEGEAKLDAQYSIDQGDYASAIALLESKAVKTDEDYLQLASAYMGQSGFSFTELVSVVNESSNDVGGESFKSFVGTAALKANSDTLSSLNKAIDAYLSNSNVTPSPSLAPSLTISSELAAVNDDIKLYLGLAYIIKAVIIIDSLTDISDVDQETVDFLNEGIDVVEYIAPNDLKKDVQEFRTEIDSDVSGIISLTELKTYLTAKGIV